MIIENPVGLRTLVKREVLRFFVVWTQTLVPPVISAFLFLFVFGFSIGRHLNVAIGGVDYIHFIVPGLVTMHLVEAPYTNASSSLFISRWHNLIQELLLSPLSYLEIVMGLLAGSIARGLIVATEVYLASLFFTRFSFHDPFVVAYFFIVITLIFACLGLLVGLWAEGFEKLSIWSSFVLSPLIYFGGVFHSVRMLPGPLQIVSHLNPIFYLVSGIRYGMTGVSDAPVGLCIGISAVAAAALLIIVERLFRAGYKLRN